VPGHVSALAVGHKLEEYRIERLLGHGGFGLTYLAQDTNLNALVAIKEFLPQEFAVRAANSSVIPKSETDVDSYRWGLDRFKDEARALARFKHPNIVRAARLIEANGTAYMVMDFEPGMTLGQYMKQVSPTLNEAQILGLFLPVLDGLEALHRMELVHRDIKPGNIYVRAQGGPMLIDFGAVRHAIGAHSRSLTSVVTAGYAPIEQYSSEGRQGPWSDLYALGATIYCCMFRFPPADAARRSAAISDGGDDPYIPAVSRGAGEYSPELLECIDWMIRFRVRDRPQNAAQLREKLRALSQQPQALELPAEVSEEPEIHFGVASDRSRDRQPSALQPEQLSEEDAASAVMLRAHSDRVDSGAASRPAANPAVAPSPQADSRIAVPHSEPLDFELPAPDVPAPASVPSAAPSPGKAAQDEDKTLQREELEALRNAKPAAANDLGTGTIIEARSQRLDFDLSPADEPTPSEKPSTGVGKSPGKSPILEKMGSGIRRAQVSKPIAAQEASARAAGVGGRLGPWPKRLAIGASVLLMVGMAFVAYYRVKSNEEKMLDWAKHADAPGAYQLYLQSCHLCAGHAEAQAAIERLENADQVVRLKTQFELLLLRKALTAPANPNATDVLQKLATLAPDDPYLAQAHTSLAAALSPSGRLTQASITPLKSEPRGKGVAKADHVTPPPAPVSPLTAKVAQTSATNTPPPAPPVSEVLVNRITASGTSPAAPPVKQVVQGQTLHSPSQAQTTLTVTDKATQQPVVSDSTPPPGSTGTTAPVELLPRGIYTPAPLYPREAILNNLQGWVDVEFTVNTDGTVSEVAAVASHPQMVFEKAATRAVGSWRFTPYTINGIRQPKRMRMRVEFKQ
jgi:TonB family protein